MSWFDGLVIGLAVGFGLALFIGGVIELAFFAVFIAVAVTRIKKLTQKTDQKSADGRIGGWNT